jgi:hypothetical protein
MLIERSICCKQAYSQGYQAGWLKAHEGFVEMAKNLQNPPPIILQGIDLASPNKPILKCLCGWAYYAGWHRIAEDSKCPVHNCGTQS